MITSTTTFCEHLVPFTSDLNTYL